MRYDLKSPCRECPFRVASCPGWLGPETGNPAAFVAPLRGHEIFPGVFAGEVADVACHVSMDRVVQELGSDTAGSVDLADHEDRLQHCAGALLFLKSTFKQPYDKEKCAAMSRVKAREPMLKDAAAFIAHHSRILGATIKKVAKAIRS